MSQKSRKKSQKFYCIECDYSTSRKNDWNKYLKTKKHNEKCFQMFPNVSKKSQKFAKMSEDKPFIFIKNCGKTYKTRAGLWKHKKNVRM